MTIPVLSRTLSRLCFELAHERSKLFGNALFTLSK